MWCCNFVLFFIFISPSGYSQQWDWTQTIGVNGSWGGHNYTWAICNDIYGNTYATGRVKGYARFGKDSLTFTGTPPACNDASSDVFLVKYSPEGNMIWAKQEPNCGVGWGRAVATDKWNNIFITGEYTDTAIFGPFILSAQGDSTTRNIFIVKYDAQGNCLWAKSVGGSGGHARGYGISTDELGNIYVVGHVTGIAFIDSIQIAWTVGLQRAFFAKFNAQGKCLWAKSIYATYGGAANSVMYRNHNIYITGTFKGEIYFGPSVFEGINPGWTDIFLVKCDTSGNFVWSNVAVGNYAQLSQSVFIDSKDHPYICGYYFDQLDFGDTVLISPFNSPTATQSRMFVARYSTTGTCQWVRSLGDSGAVASWMSGLVVNSRDEVIISSHYYDSILVDTLSLYSLGSNAFVAAFDSLNRPLWIKETTPKGNGYCFSNSISIDNNDNLFCGGQFNDTILFDSSIIYHTGEPDNAFIAKLYPPLNPLIPLSQIFVCSGDSVYLSCSASGSPLTYSWTIAGGNKPSSSENSFYVRFDSTGTFNFTVVVSNPYASDSSSGMITVFSKTSPIISLGPDTTVCSGFMLNAGNGFIQYLWTDNSTGQFLAADTSGQYFVQVTDSNYCKNRDTVNLIVNPSPSVYLGNDTVLCGSSITIDAGPGFASYLWSNGATTQNISSSTIGLYWVEVQNSYACTSTDTLLVDSCLPIIDLSQGKPMIASLFPNPFHESAYLILQGSVPPGNIRVELVDILGNTISVAGKETSFKHPGEQPLLLSRPALAPGIYLYKIYADRFFLSIGKLIIE